METNNIQDISFSNFKKKLKSKEGIVCLGAGRDSNEWVEGVTQQLLDEKIATGNKSTIWEPVFYKLTTTGKRIDLAFVFKKDATVDIWKMAMWRLKFGDCSWISDYLVNYAKHHGES